MTTPKPRATSRRKRPEYWATIFKDGVASHQLWCHESYAKRHAQALGKDWRVARVELRELRTGKGKR